MKKFYLTLAALATASASALAASTLPNALYVVKDGTYQKFNFGVASDLVFSNNGKTLSISGYNRQIDLDKIDYITFEAPMSESLTASQQKERLVKIGEKINSLIDVNRHSELIVMCNSCVECFEENWDEPNYYSSHSELGKEVKGMVKSLLAFSKGDLASVRSLTRSAVELYKLEEYFGIYEINREKQDLEKIADADHIEIRWTDDAEGDYSVKVVQNGVKRYETSDILVDVPEKIDIQFLHGNKELAVAAITSDVVQDKKIGLNLDFETNGYVVKNTLDITDDAVKENTKVWIDGTLLADASADVTGRHLLAYDELKDDLKEATHYHDEDDNCCGEDPERLLSHFIKGSANADILGELQLKGLVYDPLKVYNGVKEEDDDDDYYRGYGQINGHYFWGSKIIGMNADKSIIDLTYDDDDEIKALESEKQYYNNYSDISFFYDNASQMQGFLSFDIYDHTGSTTPWEDSAYTVIDGRLVRLEKREGGYYIDTFWYDENDDYHWEYVKVDDSEVFCPVEIIEHWYGLTPKLYFPDMTSFYLDDFFDETSFSTLVNDYDAIIDTYKSIIRQHD